METIIDITVDGTYRAHMSNDSLKRRTVEEDADLRMRSIIEEFGSLGPDIQDIAVKMLAHSSAFLGFIDYVRASSQHPQRTRLIDVGSEFQEHFKGNIASDRSMSWTTALNAHQPDILRQALSENVMLTEDRVRAGWHSVHSPMSQDHGYMMVGAKVPEYGHVDHAAQKSLVGKLFPESVGAHQNIRHPSNTLENILGLRSGRVHIFLADEALQHMDGIALDSSYLRAEADELIVFTMHARFFFICSAKDLTDWLKTESARQAFGDKLRLHGHKYPATLEDLQKYDPVRTVLSLQDFIFQKAASITKIPQDKLSVTYFGALDRQNNPPHLTWNTPVVVEQLQAQQKLMELLVQK